jgi:hypothetical protein
VSPVVVALWDVVERKVSVARGAGPPGATTYAAITCPGFDSFGSATMTSRLKRKLNDLGVDTSSSKANESFCLVSRSAPALERPTVNQLPR